MYITSMIEVLGGASEKVTLTPLTEYVFLFWYTPLMYTKVEFSLFGAADKVKTVVVPSPVKSCGVYEPDPIATTLS